MSAASTGAPLIAARDLGFAYDQKPVIKRMSFAVDEGDFVGIVGPNGSGKSTLLDLIDGVLRPGSGELLLAGRPTTDYRRREMAQVVALVPQRFALDFDLSVREVVAMGGYCRPAGAEAPEVDEVLAKLGAAPLLERRFSELSGGEQQLVVLAQALMQGARVLLLDEPASALDIAHQLRLFDLLKRINREGQTVICVLHDLNLALHYFDRVLAVSEGDLAAYGPPAEVLQAELIERVYGVRAFVHQHGGRTFLTFSPRPRAAGRGRVHLICGGGTGANLMRELVDAGYEVSAGVLNALDGDERTGRALGLRLAVEAPFAPIGDIADAENLRLIEEADAVVVTGIPVSHGNARNVAAARAAATAGTPVWAAAALFTGDAVGATAGLVADGVKVYEDDDQVTAALSELPGRA